MILIVAIFINFLVRRSDASVIGITLPSRLVHLALGPTLVLLNGVLLVYLCALYQTAASMNEVGSLQRSQKYLHLGFLVNPFYISKNSVITAVGYAFLIFLWWLGMHTFLYSIGLNSTNSPFLFGWQILISVLYLSVGLASMFAIQACWQKFGIASYQLKIWAAFVSIPVGAFLPPLLLRLGLPHLPFKF
jgi:hypothetical protein